jgi:dTDP-4-dehydrorhamnose reductase
VSAPLLVIGESGQLARAIADLPAGTVERVFAGRRSFDLGTADPGPLLDSVRPFAVVNASAYSGVDKAESEPELCYRVNRDGPGALAAACAERGLPLVHVSTDYVFDGGKGLPYVESDPVNPLNVYGRSKLEGEAAVQEAGGRSAILRTTWVFGDHGASFVLMMLKLAAERDHLRMVSDQLGRPTWSRELAVMCVEVARRLADGDASAEGLFHVAGFDDATRADMADVIFAEMARHGRKVPGVTRVGMAEFPAPAPRPIDSRLDSTLARERLGWAPRPWRETLPQVAASLL